jgi:hypothetical protein
MAKMVERVMVLSGEYAIARAEPTAVPPSRLDLHIARYRRNRIGYLRDMASDIHFTTRAMRAAMLGQWPWWRHARVAVSLWGNWIGLAAASASVPPSALYRFRIRRIISLLELMDALEAVEIA